MPTNRSENKINVTKLFGSSEKVGVCDPKPNMYVRHGDKPYWIKTVATGSFTCGLALASGGDVCRTAYPMDLFIDYALASGTWGFEAGSNGSFDVPCHGGTWPNGVTIGVGSGVTYLSGAGNGEPVTFGR